MRKFLIVFSLCLGMVSSIYAAETYTLGDGSSVSGDIVKSDDLGVMIHTTSDSFTNYNWPQFSQDSLKQLAGNPKYGAWAAPFVNPTAQQSAPPAITVKPVTRMTPPDQLHPSLFGGLFTSSLGLFLLLLVYATNLYAAFEVAVVRGKPVPAVMGLSAVLPIIGPAIFLMQPLKAQTEEAPPEEGQPGAPAPEGAAPPPGQENIEIVSASWQKEQEEKKPQPQVFARGKFTLNKRFVETKFAGFIGEPKGDAKTFTMELKTLKETIAVESIKQVGQTEMIVETSTTQLTVPFADIQEIKLNPKPA